MNEHKRQTKKKKLAKKIATTVFFGVSQRAEIIRQREREREQAKEDESGIAMKCVYSGERI